MTAGCTTDGDPTPGPPQPPSGQRQASAPAPPCPTSAVLDSNGGGFPEAEGQGDGATLWAMFFSRRAVVDEEIKIVWRMTGGGDLTMEATGPDGDTLKPSWGPQPHPASNFDRPGEEWGTGWVFPEPGCWTITATRSPGAARLTLRVDPK